VLTWRRSYDHSAPPLTIEPVTAGKDARYAKLSRASCPPPMLEGHGRALLALLESDIAPGHSAAASRVLIAAHGNSLRALVKHLDN